MKKLNKNQKNIMIGGLCSIVLLMAVGYAAFQASLNIQGTSNISSNWNVKITDIVSNSIVGGASDLEPPTFTDTTASFKTGLVSPGDSISYKITVTNAGTLDAEVTKLLLSDTRNPAIQFFSDGLVVGSKILSGETAVINVYIRYADVTSQPESLTNDFSISLDYKQSTSNGVERATELVYDGITFPLVNEGDGLYEDKYAVNRYLYKGGNPDNYINFNNEIWRIMSIETDGTMKIVRKDSIGSMPWDSRTSTTAGPRNNDNNTYCKKESGIYYGCGIWGKTSGTVSDSKVKGTVTEDATLNIYLNNTYYSGLSESAKNQIIKHDFNAGRLNGDLDYTKVVDLMVSEDHVKWNGYIALYTVSEYLKANSNDAQCESLMLASQNRGLCHPTNYLFNSRESQQTLTTSSYDTATTYIIDSRDIINTMRPFMEYAVRPVSHLKTGLTLSGTGSLSDPFIIS